MSASPVDLTKTISEVRGLRAAHNDEFKTPYSMKCPQYSSSVSWCHQEHSGSGSRFIIARHLETNNHLQLVAWDNPSDDFTAGT